MVVLPRKKKGENANKCGTEVKWKGARGEAIQDPLLYLRRKEETTCFVDFV